jgi:hypothetical protein
MIFDDYLELLINKVRKVTNEQGLLALDADVVKDMDFKEIMKAAFCTLRLSKKVDEQMIMGITKRVKGFNNRMIAWYFLKMYLEDNRILSDAQLLSLFNEEKRNLAKQFAKLSVEQKMESYRLTSLFFLKQKNESSSIEAEPEFLDFFRDEIFLKMDDKWQRSMHIV